LSWRWVCWGGGGKGGNLCLSKGGDADDPNAPDPIAAKRTWKSTYAGVATFGTGGLDKENKN